MSRTRFRSLRSFRAVTLSAIAASVFVGTPIAVSIVAGAASPALAQTTDEFREALEPYGFWQNSPRFGEVWVPYNKPRAWRPYTLGRWVYTDEWGWYWISDREEDAWGWITYHYGRWAFERGLGWVWVPGNEWAPAWVNWRNGDGVVGWAPLPPDEVIYDVDEDVRYWTFIEPRYLAAPRMRTYYIYGARPRMFFDQTVIVNRTVPLEGRRYAVNPGIAPGFVASITQRPLPTYRVQPNILPGTANVEGGVIVRPGDGRGRQPPQDGRRGGPPNGPRPAFGPVRAPALTPAAAVQPGSSVPAPQALPRAERGTLGGHAPRAAQGAQPAPFAPPSVNVRPSPPAGGPPSPERPRPNTPPSVNVRPGPPPAPSAQPPASSSPSPQQRPVGPPAVNRLTPPQVQRPAPQPAAPQAPVLQRPAPPQVQPSRPPEAAPPHMQPAARPPQAPSPQAQPPGPQQPHASPPPPHPQGPPPGAGRSGPQPNQPGRKPPSKPDEKGEKKP